MKGGNTAMSASETCVDRPEVRDLPATGWSRLGSLVTRAMLLRCPQCGSQGIFAHPWSMHECCPRCGYQFEREDGYFLGAYAFNLIVAEVIGLGTVLVVLLRSDLDLIWQQVIAVVAAILFPILFFPFSRTVWMAFDLQIHRDISDRQIRGGDFR
jgi:uncharacterized protein (DUF983 family)